MKWAAITAAALAALLSAPIANAQFVLPGIDSAVSIALTPAHPAPGDPVHLEARSSAYDLSQSTLTWRVNGKVFASGEGTTSADVVAGGLGSEIDVSADVIAPDGTESFAQVVIIPTEVDLLFDSDSYVPPFYHGRALPSAGTNIHLEAVPHFMGSNGKVFSAGDLTYTWKRNDEIIAAISGKGRFSVIVPAPVLFGTDIIVVEVASVDGTLSGEASVRIPSVEPLLSLYEDHPLYGLMYNRALGAETVIPDTEMTFAAMPYFAQGSSAADRALQYAWRVNGTPVTADATRSNELTINATNSNGLAQVALELTHATNVFLEASGSWGITLSAHGGGSSPFGTARQ